MIVPFIKEDAIEVDQLEETNSEGHRGKTSPEGLNVGTVPTFKMHNVGTVPIYKMHNDGTVPTFKIHIVGTAPTYKTHNVGTIPTSEMHNIGTIPTYKMHNIGTKLSYATLYNVIKSNSIKLNLIKTTQIR